ncbi:MAG: hypothetical protein A2W00_02405 [Candidatus Eisenbacteria bacterium RBG_16_71_46]|nr:MAG: hypothetical protein A2W00_02405 [Candidatus Eisenbacteria bacterium RBG_16_71_46]
MPLCALLLIGSCAPAPAEAPYAISRGLRLETVAEGLAAPVYLTAPSGDPRLFVVEQDGRVLVLENGRLRPQPFLDLRDRVRSGGEQGLLSLAFHPRYAENGFFYVDYTDRNGDTRIERYRVSRDPNRADPSSGRLLLRIVQPYSNHNGGLVLFGPDGMLYVGMGDGGSGGDPQGNGQNRSTLLGKLLRIDVDRGAPYAIPPDNPFASGKGGRPEIWAWGLRNPWRYAFDREAGLLYIADVGQNRWEEIDVAPADRPGLDYGWNVMEGNHCYAAPRCDASGLWPPTVEYPHPQGCSITGGFVYRGRDIPALVGHYVFSDYCSGWLRSFRHVDGRAVDLRQWDVGKIGSVSSFGLDGTGELYVLTLQGRVLRLAPAR